MGNRASDTHFAGDIEVSKEKRKADIAIYQKRLRAFGPDETRMIQATFRDLALRSPDKVIDKGTFLKFFPLPGLLGERLFKVFDRKQTGVVDFEEFVCGLSACLKGTLEEKMRFIFQVYDLTGDNAVSREELATMLYHVPRHVTRRYADAPCKSADVGFCRTDAARISSPEFSQLEKG